MRLNRSVWRVDFTGMRIMDSLSCEHWEGKGGGPGLWLGIRRHPGVRRVVRRWNGAAKRAFSAVLACLPAAQSISLMELKDVRRVLLVRPNFRIGNTLISARLIPSVQARFPGARIDFLGADKTVPLLEHLGLGRVESVSRACVYRPDRFIALIRRLRRERYDLVIDAGRGSFTAALMALMAGGRVRLGQDRGRLRCFLNVRLNVERRPYIYDGWAAFADAIHPGAVPLPLYRVSPDEREEALRWLGARRFTRDGDVLPFVAVFVGGHLDKRMPVSFWRDVLENLARNGVRLLLFDGPEEKHLVSQCAGVAADDILVVPVQSLRKTAALCEQAAFVVSPDTGTLHLAAALERPTISLLRVDISMKYAPHGRQDQRLMRPSPDDVLAAVMPLWRHAVAAQGASSRQCA